MKTIEIVREVERVGAPGPVWGRQESVTPRSVRGLMLATVFVVLTAGCDSYANKLKRDEAMASLDVSRQEQTAGQGPISLRVFGDAPGNDNRNTNGEYVTVFNSTPEATDIGGWSLCKGASYCFTFPDGASVPAEGSITLYTGSGRATATSFYMGSGRGVWDNDHDIATLRDGETVIAKDIY